MNPQCLWCRKRLKQVMKMDRDRQERMLAAGAPRYLAWRESRHPTGTYGYQGNGRFCSLRCGYRWALLQDRW